VLKIEYDRYALMDFDSRLPAIKRINIRLRINFFMVNDVNGYDLTKLQELGELVKECRCYNKLV